MKLTSTIVIGLGLFVGQSVAFAEESKPTTFAGLLFGEVQSRHANGNVRQGSLTEAQDKTIIGTTYSFVGKVVFWEQGAVKSATLSKPVSVPIKLETYNFAGGKEIQFHPNGVVLKGWLGAKNSFKRGERMIKDAEFVDFDTTGNLRQVGLRGEGTNIKVGDHSFKGVVGITFMGYEGWVNWLKLGVPNPIKVGDMELVAKNNIEFQSNGNVIGITVDGPTEVQVGDNKMKVIHIRFDKYGRVKQVQLGAEPVELQVGAHKITAVGNGHLHFYTNAQLGLVFVGESTPFDYGGNTFVLHRPIYFYEDGTVKSLRTLERQSLTFFGKEFTVDGDTGFSFRSNGSLFDIRGVRGTSRTKGGVIRMEFGGEEIAVNFVEFHKNGQMQRLGPKEELVVELGGISYIFEAGAFVSFYESGNVRSGVLSGGKKIKFDEDGSVQKK